MKVGDQIQLGKIDYEIKKGDYGYYLDNLDGCNDRIFDDLTLNTYQFSKDILGYSNGGVFPWCKTLSDLNKLTKALQEKLNPMKHNFPKGVRVVCKTKLNKDQVKEVMKLCIDAEIIMPLNINDYTTCLESGELIYVDEVLELFVNDKQHIESGRAEFIYVSFTEFKKFFIGEGKYNVFKPVSIKLNSEYTAVVNKEYVQIGCQRVEFDAVEKVFEAIQKVRSKK